MDHAAFHIVYVDKRVSASLDGIYLDGALRDLPAKKELGVPTHQQLNSFPQISSEIAVVRDNLGNLLSNFHGGTFSAPSGRRPHLRLVLRQMIRIPGKLN